MSSKSSGFDKNVKTEKRKLVLEISQPKPEFPLLASSDWMHAG